MSKRTDSPVPRLSDSAFRVWLQAARPKTLWAAVAPVLMGTALAYGDGAHHWPAAVAALAGAFLIQIATNFANDYGDFKTGADAQDRQGPLRVTQAGLVSPRAMLRAAVLTFAAAGLVCGWLVWRAGWPLALIGALAIASGVLYTGGPRPLGYMGLGDLFVFAFFGPVAVGGTYYVQALTCSPAAVLAGIAPGLLSVAILAVNNLRDRAGDARAGKRTLAVRFGGTFARAEYAFCVAGALTCVPAALIVSGAAAGRHVGLAAWSVLTFAHPLLVVCRGTEGQALNPVLGATARGLLVYAVLFAIGWLM